MNTPLIQATDLCRYFKHGQHEVRAVDRVSLDVHAGEFLTVVGSSGSGKSTLLAMLAGLDTPSSGSVTFGTTTLASMTRQEIAAYRATRMGMVFQSFNLIAHRTALQNVELALYFGDTPRNERSDRATEILTTLGLADRLDHRPADLSGGEQQRVAIARAMVKKPDILFADEPTGNLDYDHSQQIAAILTDLNSQGITIVMVTHDREMAAQCSDRIIRLVYGKIESEAAR